MSVLPDYLRHCMTTPGESAGGGSSGPGLDFENPQDNLYAFGKLWATYA